MEKNLTVIILTHNSKKIIRKCIKSIIPLKCPILIIDDSSTDSTLSIIKKIKAKVIQHSLNNNFAQQRNFALSQIKTDWAFFIDADEILEIHPSFKGFKLQSAAYSLNRLDYFMGRALKHGETMNTKPVRLVNKNFGHFVRPVHEVFKTSSKIDHLSNLTLHHHSHPDISSFIKKMDFYTNIEINYRLKQNQKFSLFRILTYPLAKFIRNYFFYLGFLDGMPGFIFALLISYQSFVTQAKLFNYETKN
jgi:glycosyltransferase involved in cell wall biosynthesis